MLKKRGKRDFTAARFVPAGMVGDLDMLHLMAESVPSAKQITCYAVRVVSVKLQAKIGGVDIGDNVAGGGKSLRK